MVGQGQGVAYEIAPDIAARARRHLGVVFPGRNPRRVPAWTHLPQADAIYVNAAATHPVRAWLDVLKPGGRLVFPLHPAGSSGAMPFVTRPVAGDVWRARVLTGVMFIPCEGAQDPEDGPASSTTRSGAAGRVGAVAALGGAPSETDWVRGDGWALSMAPRVALAGGRSLGLEPPISGQRGGNRPPRCTQGALYALLLLEHYSSGTRLRLHGYRYSDQQGPSKNRQGRQYSADCIKRMWLAPETQVTSA